MKTDEQTVKQILQVLAGEGSCDYAPVHGGVMLFDGKGERVEKGVDISTFLELRDEGLIDKTRSMRQGHMVFPSNVQVDIYRITNQGRDYLNKQS